MICDWFQRLRDAFARTEEIRELRETIALQQQTITARQVSEMAARTRWGNAERQIAELRERLVVEQANVATAEAATERLKELLEAARRHPSAGGEG